MLPNVAIEYVIMRLFDEYGELQWREQKKLAPWLKYLMLIIPAITDVCVYWTYCHPELFSPLDIRSFKFLDVIVIFATRQVLYTTGIWGTLVATSIADFVLGLATILRYYIMRLLGISLANYTSELRLLPLLLYGVTFVVMGATAVRWLKKFRAMIDQPGIILKTLGILYWGPTFFMWRPVDVLDLSHPTTIVATGGVSIAFLYLGWLFLMDYQRCLSDENRYLAMQTELLREHARIVKEQAQLIKTCEKYFKQQEMDLSDAFPKISEADYDLPVYSENEILNTAISNKIQQCREQNINLTLPPEGIRLPKGMPEVHFLTIFYNLFDNAMESACQCGEEMRYIHISAREEDNTYYLQMKNSQKPGKYKTGNLLTTKGDRKNHGLGLKIIRDVLSRNHGRLKIVQEKESFTAEVSIKC